MKDFSVKLGSLQLKTPFMLASGTWGIGDTLEKYFTTEEVATSIGALVTKGVSLDPMPGNPPPRLYETPCGLINSIGLENPGVKKFKEVYLPRLKKFGVPVIVNIHSESPEGFLKLLKNLNPEEVDGIEVNISCPNVKKGGIAFSSDPKVVKELIREVRELWGAFLMVKLSPVGPVYEVAKVCEECSVDAITLANTYPALGVIGLKPFKVIKGGLSGPAIKPLTLRLVFELSQSLKVPIVGCGGIMSGRDAWEYLCCGAKAVQVGTANLIDPRAVLRIFKEFVELGEKYGTCN